MYRSTIIVAAIGLLALTAMAHAKGGAQLVPAYYQPLVREAPVHGGVFVACREMAQRLLVRSRQRGQRIVQLTDYCVQNGGRL